MYPVKIAAGTLQRPDARSSLSRKIDRRRDGNDDRRSGRIFQSQPQDRPIAFTARRYRTGLSETGAAEPDFERWRSATTEARDRANPGYWPCAKRADP